MKAAVIHTPGKAPHYQDFADPVPQADENLVQVRAVSLKNIDKAIASGRHYHETGYTGDFIPGVDGVGALPDGTRVYFGGSRAPYGTFAEKSIANNHMFFPLPAGLDDVTAAALPNAAMSSWLPLVWRAKLTPGETVVILGATGVAGKLAIQVAKHLGAGYVIAAGRNRAVLETLPDLGAEEVIALDQPDDTLMAAFRQAAKEHHFDIVLDYVWGRPAETLINAMTGTDVMRDPDGRIRFVTIGSIAGSHISLPAQALRSTQLEIYGSGGGSIPRKAIFETFPDVMALGAQGKLKIDTLTLPLADIEREWNTQDPGARRLVFVP